MPRPPILDDVKRAEICALLAAGCSQQVAASYVGVTPAAIRNAAARNRAFHHQLLKAMQSAELDALQTIRAAAPKSWRAAAWLLERTKPQQYGYRNPKQLTADYWARFFEEVMTFVEHVLPDPKSRYEFCRRMDRLLERAKVDANLPFTFTNMTPPVVPPAIPEPTSPRYRDLPPPNSAAAHASGNPDPALKYGTGAEQGLGKTR
jgi:hypothetical protein